MTQKEKTNFAFSVFHKEYKCFEEIFQKARNYIQQPIDIGVCRVNLRPQTSGILAELFFACWRCTKSHRKHMEIRGFSFILFCDLLEFSISSRTHDKHIWLIVLWVFRLSIQNCKKSPLEGSEIGGHA